QFYPNLRERMLRVVLVHPGELILPELGESLGRYAQKVLAQRGVEIRLNTRVTSMTGLLKRQPSDPVQHPDLDGRDCAQPVAFFAAMPEGRRPRPGERVLANPRLARSLGGGRLCVRARQQSTRKVSSAHRATRHS